ncbi:MAG TPA: VOC family protein [Ilumatobacteraceae bacterium]|nr:VOC family protein [Ilumatobacteraceae bacterium]
MPDVAFKDLCIDVTAGDGRPAAVASFWGAALGQPVVAHDDGSFHLGPPENGPKQRTVWINAVPEAIAGKSRVHIDVRVADGDPAPLLDAGGTIERERDEEISWHILEDPDGVALCVFGPHPANPSALGPFELVVDAADPPAIAQWWADRTGGKVGTREGAPFVWIEGAAGFPFMFWIFHDVPEPKTVKNRVHWDVQLVDTTIDGLVAAGATLLRPKDDEIRWWVMADPEGNEFCAFE